MPPPDDSKSPAEIEASRSLAVLLPQLDHGVFNAEASDALRDLVASMRDDALARDASSKGSLTIKIDLKLDGGTFDVKADLKVVSPKKRFGRTTMWATDGNNLVAESPKQERLPFENVRKLDETQTARKI